MWSLVIYITSHWLQFSLNLNMIMVNSMKVLKLNSTFVTASVVEWLESMTSNPVTSWLGFDPQEKSSTGSSQERRLGNYPHIYTCTCKWNTAEKGVKNKQTNKNEQTNNKILWTWWIILTWIPRQQSQRKHDTTNIE